jgi:hypothetical protein
MSGGSHHRSPAATITEVEEDIDGRPLGVLSVFPAATFTEVEEDVMSMAAPLGVLAEVW